MPRATLVVHCPDRPGIVAALAERLASLGGNITQNDQHVDASDGQFFQRTCFELLEEGIGLDAVRAGIGEVAGRFSMRWELYPAEAVAKVAVMVSRFDHCLHDLLLRHRSGELSCEIAMIVSNHPDLEPVAQQFGIPYHVFLIAKATKAEQEARELALFAEAGIDLIVLARYMQVLSADFIRHYEGRIINIHHSFLPAFGGARPYRQALERGVKLIGATAHYATVDLDEGPIIAQGVVAVSHRDSLADLTRRGRDVERTVLGDAVRLHLEHRVCIHGNRTVVFG